MKKLISSNELDTKFRIFHDTKKTLHYDKHRGTWGWGDRDEEVTRMGFGSVIEAVDDAIAPYIDSEENDLIIDTTRNNL